MATGTTFEELADSICLEIMEEVTEVTVQNTVYSSDWVLAEGVSCFSRICVGTAGGAVMSHRRVSRGEAGNGYKRRKT